MFAELVVGKGGGEPDDRAARGAREGAALEGEQRAQVIFAVAMAGTPIESTESLIGLKADMHRFELNMVENDGDWLVKSAEWRRAKPDDFLF